MTQLLKISVCSCIVSKSSFCSQPKGILLSKRLAYTPSLLSTPQVDQLVIITLPIILQVPKLNNILILPPTLLQLHLLPLNRLPQKPILFTPTRTSLPSLQICTTSLFLLPPANNHIPRNQQRGTEEPERWQGFGEDEPAEDGGQHEVGGGVDYGYLGGGGAAGEGFSEEGPHYCVEEEVEGEEELFEIRGLAHMCGID